MLSFFGPLFMLAPLKGLNEVHQRKFTMLYSEL